MSMSHNSIQIELHVEDFEAIKAFYSKLGFEVIWERQPEEFKGYMVLKLNDNIVCFWAGNKFVYDQPYFKRFPKDTPRGYGVELVIVVADIESYYNLHKDHANVVEPLVMQPWGLLDFRAIDPAGYYLRFTSPHDILDPANAVD
jgi:lactoylglutathione lyase